jgi:hypothetical protein
MKFRNKGFDPKEVGKLKESMVSMGQNFVFDKDEENTEEYAHFYFVGMYEGQEVIYDAVMYTLRLHYNSELYEIAEHKAASQFPEFKKIAYDEDENGDLKSLDAIQEEIGLYMAEVIMELEAEESVKVNEHVEIDKNIDFGIGLDIGLNIEEIDIKSITKFIMNFNDDSLKLDQTLYSFQEEDLEIAK